MTSNRGDSSIPEHRSIPEGAGESPAPRSTLLLRGAMRRPLTSTQQWTALAELMKGPLVRSRAGWCHPGEVAIDFVKSRTLFSLGERGLATVRLGRARITPAGRHYFIDFAPGWVPIMDAAE